MWTILLVIGRDHLGIALVAIAAAVSEAEFKALARCYNTAGRTAAHQAAAGGYEQAVLALLDAGADFGQVMPPPRAPQIITPTWVFCMSWRAELCVPGRVLGLPLQPTYVGESYSRSAGLTAAQLVRHHPELQINMPAHTKHPGWSVDAGSRGSQAVGGGHQRRTVVEKLVPCKLSRRRGHHCTALCFAAGARPPVVLGARKCNKDASVAAAPADWWAAWGY